MDETFVKVNRSVWEETLRKVNALELEVKANKQQLADILNRGPTKTTIEMMLEKTINKAIKSAKIIKKLQEANK